jgi:hypothetical protein
MQQQTLDQRLELYQLVESSLNQMFEELIFCKDSCVTRPFSLMDLSKINPINVGCCNNAYYIINKYEGDFSNTNKANNIIERFRKLQEENSITKLIRFFF